MSMSQRIYVETNFPNGAGSKKCGTHLNFLSDSVAAPVLNAIDDPPFVAKRYPSDTGSPVGNSAHTLSRLHDKSGKQAVLQSSPYILCLYPCDDEGLLVAILHITHRGICLNRYSIVPGHQQDRENFPTENLSLTQNPTQSAASTKGGYAASNCLFEELSVKVPDKHETAALGPPFQGTTHSSTVNSSLGFQFHGSSPQVFGISLDASYECFIDGTIVGSATTLKQMPGDNDSDLLCNGTSFIEEKEYTLALNVTHTAGGGPLSALWLDYITYVPSTSAPLRSATVLVDRSDPAIAKTKQKLVKHKYFKVRLDPKGTSVSWVGFTPQMPLEPTSHATYSIDKANPVVFGLPSGSSSENLTNQVIFTSPTLSSGPHSLEVTYLGNSATPPLTLNHLVIANVSTASAQVPPATSASTDKPSVSAPIGAIIGGVIGGIAVLCFAISLLRRRSRQRKTGHGRFGNVDDTTTPPQLTPFEAMPSRPAMTEASNRALKVHHSPMMNLELNPPIFFDRPLGFYDPGATPRVQTPNQQELPLRTPPVEAVYEPGRGARSAISNTSDPPPSYASR
ncbi:hypothetical protein BD779DRAFT_1676025 [Infundibulicybe gibba]|nr:hypothetical protein BD779DRAFT_1676025 [Infundibulicybe gibba]